MNFLSFAITSSGKYFRWRLPLQHRCELARGAFLIKGGHPLVSRAVGANRIDLVAYLPRFNMCLPLVE
jgi:hypothetical protein